MTTDQMTILDVPKVVDPSKMDFFVSMLKTLKLNAQIFAGMVLSLMDLKIVMMVQMINLVVK